MTCSRVLAATGQSTARNHNHVCNVDGRSRDGCSAELCSWPGLAGCGHDAPTDARRRPTAAAGRAGHGRAARAPDGRADRRGHRHAAGLGAGDRRLQAERAGSIKVHHDIGDRVKPGEPSVELDPVDARLGVQQAESRYLGELVKLGITKEQAEEFVKKYGISEELLDRPGSRRRHRQGPRPSSRSGSPARKPSRHLTRQRALTQRGAGTPQELEDAENDWRTAAAALRRTPCSTARTVIANAIAVQGRLEPGRADA